MTKRCDVRLGFALGDYPTPAGGSVALFDSVVEQTLAAEAAGFDSVWVADHLMQTPAVAPSDDPMLECYTLLGALAALTSRVRLGAFVGCAGYRNAALLAKAVTTLDVISHGRAVFGIGAGWFEAEHDAYGYEFGSVADRYDRLLEAVAIVRSMFTAESTSYDGKHFRTDGALNYPRPLQPGGPPVLVGGSGEKRTLRIVAEQADICNVSGPPERVAHLMRVLDDHCAAVGRDPHDICRTVVVPVVVRDTTQAAYDAVPPAYRAPAAEVESTLAAHAGAIAGTADEAVEQLRAYLEAGVEGLILSCAAVDRNGDYVRLLGDLARQAFAG